CEVALCGHATLATAYTLFELGLCDKSHPGAIQLSFPIAVQEKHSDDWYRDTSHILALVLGVNFADVIAIDHYGSSYICHLNQAAYNTVQPNFTRMMDLSCLAVVITCEAPETSEYDFFSRFFAPKLGVNEDPVTGSAHCALVPYWNRNLPSHPVDFRARQTSARGGDLIVRLDNNRVLITGTAVFTLRGKLIGSIF
ncbi:phenazine biosynthesis protein PhzF family protein, partial [Thraustotheca clavata]